MTLRVEASIDTDVVQVIQEQMKQTPRIVQVVFQRALLPSFREKALALVSKTPGRPKYPLRWKSERQRRYVMAKLRQENNLPYKRTGKLNASWQVQTHNLDNGASIEVLNTSPIARYVVGDDQQPFHADTGWLNAPKAFAALSEQLTDAAIDAILDIALAPKGTRFG